MFTTTTAGRSRSSALNAPSSPRTVSSAAGQAAESVASVEDVHQQGRALDVCQEAVPESGAVAGPLDESGDVGDDGRAFAHGEDAEIGLDGGERVGGDLGVCAGERREQRRLAGVRQPDQSDVGEELQGEREPELFAVEADLGELRRLARGALETDVAAAALAAARDQQALTLGHEVTQHAAVGVEHFGAHRHLDLQHGAVGAALVGAAALAAVGGAEMVLVAEVAEVVKLARGHEDDVAARSAVAAVGSALGHVLLAAEAHGAVAAAARAHADAGPIEHDGSRRPGPAAIRPRGRPR